MSSSSGVGAEVPQPKLKPPPVKFVWSSSWPPTRMSTLKLRRRLSRREVTPPNEAESRTDSESLTVTAM